MRNLPLYVCCFMFMGCEVKENSRPSNDSVYFFQLRDSLHQYIKTDLPKARLIAQKGLTFANRSGNIRWKVMARMRLCRVLNQEMAGTSALESVRLAEEALEQSEIIGDSTLVLPIYLTLSLSYYEIGKHSEALNYSSKAIRLASSLENKVILYRALKSRANIYRELHLYDKALNDYEMLDSVLETNNYYSRGSNFHSQGILFHLHLNDFEKARLNYRRAYNLFKENDIKTGLLTSTIALGAVYTDQEEHKKAEPYFREALSLAEIIGIKTQKVIIHNYLNLLYQAQGNMDSAFYHINKALDLAHTLQNTDQQMWLLRDKALLVEQVGDSIAALKYHRMASILEDSLERRKNLPEAIKILIQDEAQVHKKQLSVYQRLLKYKNFWIWLSLAGVIILSLIVRRYQSRLSSVKQTETTLSQTLQTERETKDHLNRQIITATANLAIKNDLLSQIMLTLDQLKEKNAPKSMQREIKETQRLIEDNLELSKIWDEFFFHFEKVHPDFLETLRSKYKLTPSELRLSAFIRLNLSYKEIGQLLNVQQASLHNSIHRIRKKMGLGRSTNIYDFFCEQ